MPLRVDPSIWFVNFFTGHPVATEIKKVNRFQEHSLLEGQDVSFVLDDVAAIEPTVPGDELCVSDVASSTVNVEGVRQAAVQNSAEQSTDDSWETLTEVTSDVSEEHATEDCEPQLQLSTPGTQRAVSNANEQYMLVQFDDSDIEDVWEAAAESPPRGLDVLPETLTGDVLPKVTTDAQEQFQPFTEETTDEDIPHLVAENENDVPQTDVFVDLSFADATSKVIFNIGEMSAPEVDDSKLVIAIDETVVEGSTESEVSMETESAGVIGKVSIHTGEQLTTEVYEKNVDEMMPIDVDECCHSDVTADFMVTETVHKKQTSCMEQIDPSVDHSSFVADVSELSCETMVESETVTETSVAAAENRVWTIVSEQIPVETFDASTEEVLCLESDMMGCMEIQNEMLDPEKRDRELVGCMEMVVPETFEAFETEILSLEENKMTESEVESDMLTVESRSQRDVQTWEQVLPTSTEDPLGEIVDELAEQGLSNIDVLSELLTGVDTARKITNILEQFTMTVEEPAVGDVSHIHTDLANETDIQQETETWSNVSTINCLTANAESVSEVYNPDNPCDLLDPHETSVTEPNIMPYDFQSAIFEHRRETFSSELEEVSVFERDLSEMGALQQDVLLCTNIESPFCDFPPADLHTGVSCATDEQICSIAEERFDGEISLIEVSTSENEDVATTAFDNSHSCGKLVTYVCGGVECHQLENTKDLDGSLIISVSDSGSVRIDDTLPEGESVILRNLVNSLGICISFECSLAEERAVIAPAALSGTSEQHLSIVTEDMVECEGSEQSYDIGSNNDSDSVVANSLSSSCVSVTEVSSPVAETGTCLPYPACLLLEQSLLTDCGLTSEFEGVEASAALSCSDVESYLTSETILSLASSCSRPSDADAVTYCESEGGIKEIVPFSDEVRVNQTSLTQHEELFNLESNICQVMESVDADVDAHDLTHIAPVEVCSVIPLANVDSVVLQLDRCHLANSVTQETTDTDGREQQSAVAAAGITRRRMTLRVSTGLVVFLLIALNANTVFCCMLLRCVDVLHCREFV
jgi:hypothetical protein